MAFDLPTQIGMDSDHALAQGEVGKVGVAIDSLEDMEALFDGIPLERVSTSMTINATAAILLALYVAVAKKQGANLQKLSGTVQNDMLKEYIARGTFIYPVAPAMRIVTDIFAWCRDELPRWNTISISGYHIREAGSTAVQEVAFTLADAIAYVEAARASWTLRWMISRRSFHFFSTRTMVCWKKSRSIARRGDCGRTSCANDLAREIRVRCCCDFTCRRRALRSPRSSRKIILCAWRFRRFRRCWAGANHCIRIRLDEALALPTEDSALIALRTQQIMAHETGVTNTVDPVAGSYAIENLTDRIEAGAKRIHRAN